MTDEEQVDPPTPKTQSQADEARGDSPGKVPGEGAGPAEAAPGATDSRGDTAVTGGDSAATGTTPTEGGGDGTNVGTTGGDTGGGGAEGAGPSGGATP